MEQDAGFARTENALREVFYPPEVPEAEVEVRWEALQARYRDGEGGTHHRSLTPQGYSRLHSSRLSVAPWSRRSTQLAIGIAATVATVVGVMTYRSSQPEPVRRYTTASGQRSTVRLADGSRILLGPATAIAVSGTSIDVTGEAYFDIAPRAGRAMIVRTSNTAVRVLGTQFSVRHYSNDATTRVVVATGKVGVEARSNHESHTQSISQPVVVAASSMAEVADSTVIVTNGVSAAEYIAWVDDRLVFKGVPLRDVVAELNRIYATDIRIPDTVLAKQPLMMDVSTQGKTIVDVLRLIGRATDSHYTHDKHGYLLIPGSGKIPAEHAAPPHRELSHSEKMYGE